MVRSEFVLEGEAEGEKGVKGEVPKQDGAPADSLRTAASSKRQIFSRRELVRRQYLLIHG
jgi:hypothetical protein